jgi:hypothetical protein
MSAVTAGKEHEKQIMVNFELCQSTYNNDKNNDTGNRYADNSTVAMILSATLLLTITKVAIARTSFTCTST